MLENIHIVLVRPSHPGNIGATARAMKTMGLTSLSLVAPKSFPDAKATALAAGADDVLQNARVFDSLSSAIAECTLVYGTSSRERTFPLPLCTPRQAANNILSHAINEPIAILFGCERSGLNNEELNCCHAQLYIPTNSTYASLNLAQAVQIIAYEIMSSMDPDLPIKQTSNPKPKAADFDRFFDHLAQTLVDIEFLNPSSPRHLMQRLKRFFHRAQPDRLELNLFRGILAAMNKAMDKHE